MRWVTASLLIAAVLAGCSAAPAFATPENSLPLSTWVAGDSNAISTGTRLGAFTIALSATGFLTGNETTPSVPDRIDEVIAELGAPEQLLIIAGGNDVGSGLSVEQVSTAADQLHDRLEADGIDVRFVTEPVPTGNGWWVPLAAVNNHLVATHADTIDCAGAGHPTSGDGLHPTTAGFNAYAACIRQYLGA